MAKDSLHRKRRTQPSGDAQLTKETIIGAFDESIRVKRAFLRENLDTLINAIEAITVALQKGNK